MYYKMIIIPVRYRRYAPPSIDILYMLRVMHKVGWEHYCTDGSRYFFRNMVDVPLTIDGLEKFDIPNEDKESLIYIKPFEKPED